MVIKGSAYRYPNKEMRTEIAVSGLQIHDGDENGRHDWH